jgi:protein-S-isoprenylcysteine O-methyltransferase Ste14
MKRYQEWAKREHSTGQWLITLVLAGLLIVVTIPFLVVIASLAIDRWLGLPSFAIGAINPIAGFILAVLGLGLGLWSIQAQITIGKGTPVPMVPTKKLVVQAPFTYCRNPMTLGTIVAYLGVCVWIGSISALVIVLILSLSLTLYIKLLEEKELEARFGAEYLAYKRSTPFILPRKPKLK